MRNYTQLHYEFLKWEHIVNNVNRYHTKTPLLDLLWDNRSLLEYSVHKDETFFRGRVFNLDDIVSTNDEYVEWVDSKEKVFEGYNESASGAPPTRSATEGRLNGKGISFLYTCNNKKTVIYELRPTKNEKISIAEFITKQDLVFADLTKFNSNKINNQKFSDLIRLIAEEFSTPHYAGHNYCFTQYLAGQFMNMGFDGIIFASSLDSNGENFVFFNPKSCKAVGSKLYIVDDISIEFAPISRLDFQYFN